MRTGVSDVCNYCGCRAIPAIAELTDQHEEIADVAGDLERAIAAGHLDQAGALLTELRRLLGPHVALEEVGLFSVLGALEEFADGVDTLYDDHDSIEAALDERAPDWDRVRAAVHQLFEHMDREEHGLFPASLATFTNEQWDRVHALQARLHTDSSHQTDGSPTAGAPSGTSTSGRQ